MTLEVLLGNGSMTLKIEGNHVNMNFFTTISYSGYCGQGRFPILTAINTGLFGTPEQPPKLVIPDKITCEPGKVSYWIVKNVKLKPNDSSNNLTVNKPSLEAFCTPLGV